MEKQIVLISLTVMKWQRKMQFSDEVFAKMLSLPESVASHSTYRCFLKKILPIVLHMQNFVHSFTFSGLHLADN